MRDVLAVGTGIPAKVLGNDGRAFNDGMIPVVTRLTNPESQTCISVKPSMLKPFSLKGLTHIMEE